jgi:hypothetical protein
MAFPRSKFYHVKAKLLETHGHDLVLLFRLPNLPHNNLCFALICKHTAAHTFFCFHCTAAQRTTAAFANVPTLRLTHTLPLFSYFVFFAH